LILISRPMCAALVTKLDVKVLVLNLSPLDNKTVFARLGVPLGTAY